jgi:hypothetical protein
MNEFNVAEHVDIVYLYGYCDGNGIQASIVSLKISRWTFYCILNNCYRQYLFFIIIYFSRYEDVYFLKLYSNNFFNKV